MANALAPPQPRTIPIGKTVLLSIVTFGIYYAIWFYRNSNDIQSRPGGFGAWKVLFWLGFVTFGLTWIGLVVLNFLAVSKLRGSVGADNGMGIAALVCYFVVNPVGSILWASHWNDTLGRLLTSGPASRSGTSTRPTATK